MRNQGLLETNPVFSSPSLRALWSSVCLCFSVCIQVTQTRTCRKHVSGNCSLTSGNSLMTRISGSWKVSERGGWNKQEKPLWRCEWKSTEPSLPLTFFRSSCLPATGSASDRLLPGQVYRGRCGQGKKETHTNTHTTKRRHNTQIKFFHF